MRQPEELDDSASWVRFRRRGVYVNLPRVSEPSWVFRVSRAALLGLWVISLLLLLAGLGRPVAQRTQEARVLETAREMCASTGWRQWMIPKLNGDVRLAKPPLAYWAAAGGFRLFGVNEFAGRLPFALAGWLTIAVLYRFGRGLFDRRFGVLSAGILATSYMFFRHFRLAETDSLAGLFVAAAMYWFWRGSAREASRRTSVLAFNLAGAAVGLAVLAKGPPGVFPVLFFIVWVIVERNWGALRRFAISGGPVTAAVVAGWWFLYARTSPDAHVLIDEMKVVTAGEDHVGPFYEYFPWLLRATAPWSGLFVLGLIWAIRDWRASAAGRAALIWVGVILIPLCCIGNKQDHYLVPLAPGLAMLGALAVYRGWTTDERDARAVAWVMGITVGLMALAPVGVFWMARHSRGSVGPLDFGVMGLIILAATITAVVWRARGLGAGVAALIAGLGVGFAVMIGYWIPSLQGVSHRTAAATLRGSFGDRPYVFYAKDPSFPLIWNLRTVVPCLPTAAELEQALAARPTTVVIAQTKNNRPPPPIPSGLTEAAHFDIGDEKMTLRVYVKVDQLRPPAKSLNRIRFKALGARVR